MRDHYEPPNQYAWIVYGIAAVMFGGIAGYVLSNAAGHSHTPPVAAIPASGPAAPVLDESTLRAYRDILTRDPKNTQAAVAAANLLYDAQRYVEAIPYYQQAFALNPSDINVSTDLGTALWYSGRPDEALTQYDRSLKLNPAHAQTLFNVGIVRSDAKGDYAGAISAWEALLKSNPDYREAARVTTMLADARAKLRS